MTDPARQYLHDLEIHLRPLPPAERDDVLREIGSHLEVARRAGTPLEEVLTRLGSPRILARAYLADFHLRTPAGVSGVWRRFAFFATTGFTGLAVVPALALLLATLTFIMLFTPVALLLRLLGVPGYFIGFGEPMPVLLAIPIGTGVTLLAFVLARGTLRLAHRYFCAVAAGYRSLRQL
ncbi:putative membrane protein [Deinobacterium chartae]|uniref:Putative membrane protein n=1 Tax=Deinobacterium chartae TaxID=521158 RepID=A0A841HZC3_9DEIO|nr:DUF1700 domain-containing protein [Deinobacterium chartae]MBB6097242.1 putative membrane protein [Deinobacterium chartae]